MAEDGGRLNCQILSPSSMSDFRSFIAAEERNCSNLTEFYKSRKAADLANKDIFAELCWVVYTSGFRYSVIQRYWPSLVRAYHSFKVEKVARLARNLESNAARICEVSTFHNLRKAEWCILNARRIIELDEQLEYIGGVRGLVIDLANKSQVELMEQIPELISTLRFKGIGETTIFHLLKNLGIDTFKPDRHLRRVLSAWGLTDRSDASIAQICSAMEYLSAETGSRVNVLDTILFHYGQRTGHAGR